MVYVMCAVALVFAQIALFLGTLAAQSADGNWPQYRGPQSSGVSNGHPLPTEWHIASGKNIKWKISTEGLGHSSPVIWGDRLFITTAVRESGEDLAPRLGIYGAGDEVADREPRIWKIYCFDKSSGKLLWEQAVHRGVPQMPHHVKASHANSTVSVDADRLVAFFGSEGLYCLDHDGNILWEKQFGPINAGPFNDHDLSWGVANSPVIYQNKVAVLVDHLGQSFLTVLNLADGSRLWRKDREEDTTWGAPLVVTAGGRTQVVVNGFKHAGGYDFETGEELWKVSGGGDIPTPTPIFGEGMFFFTNYHGGMSPVYAVSAEFRAAVKITPESEEGVAWISRRTGSYMQTPLLLDGLLYVPRWRGVLVCLRPETGETVYQKRLGTGAFTSSPVGGDGKLYVASEDGEVYVVTAGEEFRILAKNVLGEPTLASPAISEGVIYYRTSKSLIAIERR